MKTIFFPFTPAPFNYPSSPFTAFVDIFTMVPPFALCHFFNGLSMMAASQFILPFQLQLKISLLLAAEVAQVALMAARGVRALMVTYMTRVCEPEAELAVW